MAFHRQQKLSSLIFAVYDDDKIHLSLRVGNFHRFKHLLLSRYLLYKDSTGNSKAYWFHTGNMSFSLSSKLAVFLHHHNRHVNGALAAHVAGALSRTHLVDIEAANQRSFVRK